MEKTRSFETYDTVITDIQTLSPRVKSFRFQLAPGKEIRFKAGQFVQVYIPMATGVRRTAYSIASPPQETTHVDLVVTLVQNGISSPYLHYLIENVEMQIMGPLGKFTLPEALPRDTVFIATGSGIAPFRSMILDQLARNTPQKLSLVFGNRFESDILYRTEFEALARERGNFDCRFVLSKPDSGWSGGQGYVQDNLEATITDHRSKDFYICGLVKMIEAVSAKLQSLGVPKEQIHYERYD